METGLENELTTSEFDYAGALDKIYDLSGGQDSDYPNRPGSGGDQLIDESFMNYDAAANESRWGSWFEDATAYGVENLSIQDQVLYAEVGYKLGSLSEEEAQAVYDPAYEALHSDKEGYNPETGELTETISESGSKLVTEITRPVDFSNYGGTLEWSGDSGNRYNAGLSNTTERVVEDKGGLGGAFATVMQDIAPVVVKGALSAALGAALGPVAGKLTGALINAGVSPAVASGIAKAAISSAQQLIMTGEVDPTTALIAAAGGYFEEAGIGGILGDSELGDMVSGVTDKVKGVMTQVNDLVSTGMPLVDAAIQAGGIDLVKQMITTGEVDLGQALTAAVNAGLGEQISGMVQEAKEAALAAGTSEDEFDAWLAQDEEISQAFIDADVKDPFLNPNYTTIGDGLMQNADGEVFNYDGDSIGNMSDLDVDGDGVLNANDLEYVEATGEYRSIPQDVQDALDPPINETPALQLQDGNTYYLDADGNVYSRDQVEWRGGDTNDYVVIGTDIVAGTTATYSQGSDVFYDDDMKIVLRGEDAGIINIGTGNEFTYGEQYSGNQIFDAVGGIPDDLGAAQYSGTIRGAPGDPGAEFDVYYNPETNTTYLVNQADPTQVNKIEDTTPEEVQQEPESDPVDSTDNALTGGDANAGDDGSPNENPYEENTNVSEEVVDSTEDATVDNPLLNNNSTNDTTDPNPSTEETSESTEETTEETTENTEIVDSNGEVVVETGSSNPTHRTDQVTGFLGGVLGSVSGQAGDTSETGTEDGNENGDNSGEESSVGEEGEDPDGTDSTETGPGDDTTGTGDPGIGDGTGGDGNGGGGGGGGLLGGGGDFTPKWGELFKYTDITPAQAKKMAPMYDYIKQTKGMLS